VTSIPVVPVRLSLLYRNTILNINSAVTEKTV